MMSLLLLSADNYGSFGDDNTSDEDADDDDSDNEYYESGAAQVTLPDSDLDYPEFGVPNIGLFFLLFCYFFSSTST